MNDLHIYLGIDFGTSGVRAVAIAADGSVQTEVAQSFEQSEARHLSDTWRHTLFALLEAVPLSLRQRLKGIAIDGTSSTVLLCDRNGEPVAAPILYYDNRGQSMLGTLSAIAPANHPVLSATSSLAKWLWWCCQAAVNPASDLKPLSNQFFLHQADWLSYLLHGQLGISDYNNALKLGYDPETERYPEWMQCLPPGPKLPRVVSPGTAIGTVQAAIAARYALPLDCQVRAGTTDSIAAFLASGATQPGEAVTSLGSSLAVKLLSPDRVDNARYGIYSHRLGNHWLVGGASNTGGAVLKHYFSKADLETLSCQIDPQQPSPYHYYPLLQPGERFPTNDPSLQPCLEPRPDNPVDFLHGLLESIARIESEGYRLLQNLGAPPLRRVYTAGGGARNPTWMAIRQRYLQVPVLLPANTAAAYGSALLAKGLENTSARGKNQGFRNS